ncbi:hypothetical protein [Pseudonocardia asaccharolytica]|uniref:Uncharacterized protein n=1 Tax=Pseudonocardia asaccharolytica DSM 44247 = NBRC 16224 TaxID=1123024 RepID=A0A511CYM2_9PSEU|nr:hypothetical protein [Pseudonocardia asaccharolytica]GEL17660.1 hypothetical protein PA7_14970 [Pseudonocardia asaccharolytica DSM 44247 = NBRC 16224]
MELGTYAPRPREESIGDQLQAKEAVDRPLIVFVREHRTGITTRFKPDGDGVGIILDIADVHTNEVWLDVLWMNGAVVDNLAPYVGQAVPIKLVWASPKNGGNPYISLVALDGPQLAQAQTWAAANPTRFDDERANRSAAAEADDAQTQAASTSSPPSAPAPAAGSAPLDPNDPAVAALLAQLNAQQTTAS